VVQGTLQRAASPKAQSRPLDWPAPDDSLRLRVVSCVGRLPETDNAQRPDDDAEPRAGVVRERVWPVPRTVPDN
jgi:hypothetical protein